MSLFWTPTNSDTVIQSRGAIVRLGAAPDSVLLAQADVAANLANVVGTRVADVLAGASGPVFPLASGVLVRMDAEPTVGQVIYVSAATPGIGTTTPPVVEAGLGLGIYEKFQDEGVWYAKCVPIKTPASAQLVIDYTIPGGPGVTDISAAIDPALYDGVDVEWWDPGQISPPNPGIQLTGDAATGSSGVGDSNAWNTVEFNRAASNAWVKRADAVGGPRAGFIRLFKLPTGSWFYRSESYTFATSGDMSYVFAVIMGTIPGWTTALHARVTSPSLPPGGRWVFRARRSGT